jgi:hypothetical protein
MCSQELRPLDHRGGQPNYMDVRYSKYGDEEETALARKLFGPLAPVLIGILKFYFRINGLRGMLRGRVSCTERNLSCTEYSAVLGTDYLVCFQY